MALCWRLPKNDPARVRLLPILMRRFTVAWPGAPANDTWASMTPPYLAARLTVPLTPGDEAELAAASSAEPFSA